MNGFEFRVRETISKFVDVFLTDKHIIDTLKNAVRKYREEYGGQVSSVKIDKIEVHATITEKYDDGKAVFPITVRIWVNDTGD